MKSITSLLILAPTVMATFPHPPISSGTYDCPPGCEPTVTMGVPTYVCPSDGDYPVPSSTYEELPYEPTTLTTIQVDPTGGTMPPPPPGTHTLIPSAPPGGENGTWSTHMPTGTGAGPYPTDDGEVTLTVSPTEDVTIGPPVGETSGTDAVEGPGETEEAAPIETVPVGVAGRMEGGMAGLVVAFGVMLVL